MAPTKGSKTSKQKIAEQEARMRDLEQEIARLQEKPEQASAGTAAGVLKGLGGMLPGLDQLLEAVGTSEAFQARLKAVDEELETRLRSAPLDRVEVRHGVSSIPGRARGSPMGRTPAGRRRTPSEPRSDTVEEPPADVFDEGSHLKVVAELPGVEEKDITVDLTGARLVISAKTLAHKYHREIALPCVPEGKVERLYRNGVLELTLWKE